MKITITVDMDNDAFEDLGELGRILKVLSEFFYNTGKLKWELKEGSMPLIDINGNKVGDLVIGK